MAAEKNQQLLEEVDRFLSGCDRDLNPEMDGEGRWRAGVGIYYFDNDLGEAQKLNKERNSS